MTTKKHITTEEAKRTGKRLGIKWDKFNVAPWVGIEPTTNRLHFISYY